MKSFKIIFEDKEGNELYSKFIEDSTRKEAIDYALKVLANDINNAYNFKIYKS